MRERKWITALLVLAILVTLGGPSAQAKNKKKAARENSPSPAAVAEDLVWPLPPNPPRIRWLGQLSKFKDVMGKKEKKQSWFERMAGVQRKEEKDKKLERPYGVAVDSQGRIFVADAKLGGVVVLDRRKKKVAVWGKRGRFQLVLPAGVALDREDRLFVSDAARGTITCFGPDGVVLSQFGFGKLKRPAGLAVDRVRNFLYVADAAAHQVAVFDLKDFSHIRFVGDPNGAGSEPGQLRTPTNVAVDRRGNLYVSDTFNNRVQIFTRRGRFVRAFGETGDGPGHFARPKGIAVDSEGHIYVADATFDNFQIFDQDGRTLLFVGSRGFGPGQFLLVAGLFIDEEDRIYVTDFSGRVQMFQYIPQVEESGEGGDRNQNPADPANSF